MSQRGALGLALLCGGVVWLLDAADVVDLSYGIWIGVLLIAIGLLIALTPGRHGLLVLVGVLVVLAGIPALFVDPDLLRGGVGEATEEPQTRLDLEPYRQGIGKLTVDLTEPGLELDGEVVEASIGIGELLVLVPLDTDVTVDAHVGVGHAEVLGEEEDGVDFDLDSISGTSGSQEVTLDLEVGVGNLRVERG
jgi:predicted membrane protein